MHKLIKFKSTPIPAILSLKNGLLSFRCTCGGIGVTPIRLFSKKTRCHNCMKLNRSIRELGLVISKDDQEELFQHLYVEALDQYIETKDNRSTYVNKT